MHAFAAVLHGASLDGSGFGFGVVVLLAGGFGVVLGVVGVELDVDDDVGAELLVAGLDGGVLAVSVATGTFCWPAVRSTGSLGDEQALSTAAAATAAPTISLRTRIGSPLTGGPYA